MDVTRLSARSMMPMPIYLNWEDTTHRILRWEFVDPWTWDEVVEADDGSTNLHDAATAPIHSILDFRRSTRLPHGILSHFPDIAHMMDDHPMGAAPVVIVGVQGVAKRMAGLLERWNSMVVVVETLDEALTLIEGHRSP